MVLKNKNSTSSFETFHVDVHTEKQTIISFCGSDDANRLER